mgnify:CR=1 FL=1|jgi:hypothetical protein
MSSVDCTPTRTTSVSRYDFLTVIRADSRFELKQSKGTIKAEWSDDYPYQVC